MKMKIPKVNTNRIRISTLGTFSFCEYRFYLEEVEGLKAPPTQAMLYGTQQHAMLNKPFLLATKQISIEEAILQGKLDGIETVRRNVIVKGNVLHGKIDRLYLGPNEIRIIDYKPEIKAHQSSVNQVFGYCSAFREQFHPTQQIIGVIENRTTQNVIWEEPFTETEDKATNRIVERIQGIIRGEFLPIPKQVPEICRSCRFNYLCEMKSV